MIQRTLAIVAVMGLFVPAIFAQTTNESAKDNLPSLVSGSNAFAMGLYAKLAAEKKGNLFFSPASIHMALVMTYAGAAGNTSQQMAKALHITMPKEKLAASAAHLLNKLTCRTKEKVRVDGQIVEIPSYELNVANALWGQINYSFKPDFIQTLQKNYGARLHEVDFTKPEKARTSINDWTTEKTKGKITDLIPNGQLDAMTRLVLTNAVYFKSSWLRPFPKTATHDGSFRITHDKSVQVPMMHMELEFCYSENDDVQLLAMPYLNGELWMIVILPKKAEGLAEVEKKFTANIDQWVKMESFAKVDLTFPKFSFNGEFQLKEMLKSMGMSDAFDGKANFSGITTKEGIFISNVNHKVFGSVDETGTEITAASAAGSLFGGTDTQKTFTADHPFIFLIRRYDFDVKDFGEILFIGRVMNPKGE